MLHVEWVFGAAVAATVLLVGLVALRPGLTAGRGGRMLAFVALFLLPALLTAAGLSVHLEQAKSTEFCLSCHVMEPYGESLAVDEDGFLPAAHYQNRRVPRDQACYSCHTDYTLFGDVRSKLRGARHLWVNYVVGPPEPADIELYTPFRNRECLHCHDGARSFVDNEIHLEILADLRGEETSCLDCHGDVHDVGNLAEHAAWSPPPAAEPGAAAVTDEPAESPEAAPAAADEDGEDGEEAP